MFRRWHNLSEFLSAYLFHYPIPIIKRFWSIHMECVETNIFFFKNFDGWICSSMHVSFQKWVTKPQCSLRLRREEIGLSHKTPVSLQSSKTLQFCNAARMAPISLQHGFCLNAGSITISFLFSVTNKIKLRNVLLSFYQPSWHTFNHHVWR